MRNNLFHCVHENHKVEDITGVVKIILKDGNIHEQKFHAVYCPSCKAYFVPEQIYLNLKKQGTLQCYVLEREEFVRYGKRAINFGSSESVLMKSGYNVKAQVGLSDVQRQAILSGVMSRGVLTPSQVISYLSLFAARKRGIQGYENAVAKWEADRRFVENYRNGRN